MKSQIIPTEKNLKRRIFEYRKRIEPLLNLKIKIINTAIPKISVKGVCVEFKYSAEINEIIKKTDEQIEIIKRLYFP